MTSERIFNIFLYFDGDKATDYGMRYHRADGTDEDKRQVLLSNISDDHLVAQRFRLRRTFTRDEWTAVLRRGHELEYFVEGFNYLRAPAEVVFCITAIVDGRPMVDKMIGASPFRGEDVTHVEGQGKMSDYLEEYTSGNTFNFPKLIHEDYFVAIKTLYNAKLYVSCAKLLLSAIDTMAFVEYGDTQGNFSKWLDRFVVLAPLGITSTELWEFRNSLVHMTNLSSRAVIAGKVSPISIFIGQTDKRPPAMAGQAKPFSLFDFMMAVAAGIGKWAESYNADPDRFLKFIERYDSIISDSRMAVKKLDGPLD